MTREFMCTVTKSLPVTITLTYKISYSLKMFCIINIRNAYFTDSLSIKILSRSVMGTDDVEVSITACSSRHCEVRSNLAHCAFNTISKLQTC